LRKIVIKPPKNPTTAIPIMINPIGTLKVTWSGDPAVKVGMINGGGGVKVGKRVGAILITNCDAKVGSTVGVPRGVGVGGGWTRGR
jgi:hypothetical protein